MNIGVTEVLVDVYTAKIWELILLIALFAQVQNM